MRKLAAASTGFCDLCFRRLGMYTAPNKQAAPNNGLTVNCAMTLQGPSHCRYICLKHRVAILGPQWKVAVYRNLTACIALGCHVTAIVSGWSQLYLTDLEWSTDALRHNSGLQPWGPSERWEYTETWLHAWAQWARDVLPGSASWAWTWKWAKWTTVWAVWTISGQNVLKVRKTFLEMGKKIYSSNLCITEPCVSVCLQVSIAIISMVILPYPYQLSWNKRKDTKQQ